MIKLLQKNIFGWLLLFGVIAINLSGNDNTVDSRGFIVKVGDICPDFSLQFPDGSEISSGDLIGTPFMLQFTASWCSVCRREMPHIEKEIWRQFMDQGFKVIGVDRDEPRETVIKFAEEMKITYPLALDPGAEIFSKFALKESGVTRNVLVDSNGRIVFLTRLFEEDEFTRLVSIIKNLVSSNE